MNQQELAAWIAEKEAECLQQHFEAELHRIRCEGESERIRIATAQVANVFAIHCATNWALALQR